MMTFQCNNKVPREGDLVREEYKKYKRRKPPPNFDDVIDFTRAIDFADRIQTVQTNSICNGVGNGEGSCKWHRCGLTDPSTWIIYELKSCPGFMFIPNPFQQGAQRYWSLQAITEYTRKPFPCNLDVHMQLDTTKTIWDISLDQEDPEKFMERLRWCHLGYHFDYNVVDYKQKHYYGFPTDLQELMECIATALGYTSYVPETAIVNYYPIGSSMGGHTDHYEEELDQPLISVSFGQPAVFLIGGPTRDIRPEAIWIRSGDVVIMSGPSRVAFHAVPCIVKDPRYKGLVRELEPCSECVSVQSKNDNGNMGQLDLDNCLCKQEGDKDAAPQNNQMARNGFKECICNDFNVVHAHRCIANSFKSCSKFDETSSRKFDKYMSRTRININVRQVHKQTISSNTH